MDLRLSDEQQLLVDSARRFFEHEFPSETRRQFRGDEAIGHSPDLWARMADQGWLGLAFPEEEGGSGGTLLDLGLVVEEAGRSLIPTTFRSTLQAALVVSALGTSQQRKTLLGRLSTGELVAALAFAEPQAIHDPRYFSTEAVEDGDDWVLSGTKSFVANAQLADPLLVVARTGPWRAQQLRVFLVPAVTDGVDRRRLRTFAGDPQFTVQLDHVRLGPESILGAPGTDADAWPALAQAREQATALLCAEMVGGAKKVVEVTAAYVTGRVQFGRPIGSFQAVQHHLANAATAVTGARLATYQALWRLSEGLPARREVALAKAWTSEAYKGATLTAHQLHGGMGYVLESDLHLWSEHAKACEIALGSRDHHLKTVATELGLSA